METAKRAMETAKEGEKHEELASQIGDGALASQTGDGTYGATSLANGDESMDLQEVVEEFGFRWIHLKMMLVQWLISACPACVNSATPFLLENIREEYGVDSRQSAMVCSGVLVGGIVGVLLFGPLNDKIGRRLCMLIQIGGMAFFSFLHLLPRHGKFGTDEASFSNFSVLLALRVLIGLCFGPLAAFSSIHFTEFLPTKRRGTVLALSFVGWTLGTIYAIGIAQIFEGQWRIILCAPLLPSCIAFPILFMLPESPRFLYVSGMYAQGVEVVTQVLSSPQFMNSPRMSRVSSRTRVSIKGGIDSDNVTCQDLLIKLFSRELYKTTFVCCGIYLFVAGSTYGFGVWVPTIMKELLKLERLPYTIFLWGKLGCGIGVLAVAFGIDLVGRKHMIVLSFIVGSGVLLLWSMLKTYVSFFVLYLVYEIAVEIVWCSLGIWGLEVFPTMVRGTASAVATMCGRVSAITMPMVLGWVMDRHLEKHMGCYAAIYTCSGFLILGAICATAIPRDTSQEKLNDV